MACMRHSGAAYWLVRTHAYPLYQQIQYERALYLLLSLSLTRSRLRHVDHRARLWCKLYAKNKNRNQFCVSGCCCLCFNLVTNYCERLRALCYCCYFLPYCQISLSCCCCPCCCCLTLSLRVLACVCALCRRKRRRLRRIHSHSQRRRRVTK